MSIEFLVKLRDAAQMMADAANEQLEKMEPPNVKNTWTPDKIKWVQADGTKGPYERYPAEGEKPENTADYKNMLADLKERNGKLTKDGYFFWIFTDNATVGRKKRTY